MWRHATTLSKSVSISGLRPTMWQEDPWLLRHEAGLLTPPHSVAAKDMAEYGLSSPRLILAYYYTNFIVLRSKGQPYAC